MPTASPTPIRSPNPDVQPIEHVKREEDTPHSFSRPWMDFFRRTDDIVRALRSESQVINSTQTTGALVEAADNAAAAAAGVPLNGFYKTTVVAGPPAQVQVRIRTA